MSYSPDQYKSKAQEIFNQLMDKKQDGSVFKNGYYWRIGCVYDTLLDYMQYAVLQKKITTEAAKEHNKALLDIYSTKGAIWYDDFCWWIIAVLKSYPYHELFSPADIERCGKIIKEAWEIVDKGKPGVDNSAGAAGAYDACDKKVYGAVEPLYPGGTWQYDIFSYRATEPEGFQYDNPIDVTINGQYYEARNLGPYQLSVMYGLTMVMTQRMSNYYDKNLEKNAILQYGFIKDWTSEDKVKKEKLLNPFGSGGKYGLIRERVGRYATLEKEVTMYNSAYQSWAGDQGLFTGGLYDYFLVKKDLYCMDLITKILEGVKMEMTMSFPATNGNNYNAIYHWSGKKDPVTGPPGPISTDPADYSCGLGVFMRYLYYCCQDDSIRNSISGDPTYQELIRQTADACFDDAYPRVMDEDLMFRQFNRLASLLAAIRIL
jgi:hypothetical protein